MLRFPYHARYALIEFAVYVLAIRALYLLPLHSACVGRKGRGLLLVGDSGTGKSILALHAMLNGLNLLSGGSVFIRPAAWLACGAPNFLHLRSDSLRSLSDKTLTGYFRGVSTICRRRGIEKFEVDLGGGNWPIARQALYIANTVFLSKLRSGVEQLLQPLPRRRFKPMLLATQSYAAGLDGWSAFCKQATASQAYILMRGPSPTASIEALMTLL
jgi:hypothetical protein